MAGYEISGLDGWKRRVCVWSMIGLFGSLISHPPLGAIAIGLLFGGMAGAGSVALALRDQSRFTWPLPYLGIGLTILCVLAIHERLGALAWFSIGSLTVVAEVLSSALLGLRAVRRLNHQHREALQVIENLGAGHPKQQFVPKLPSADLSEAFVAAVPENLRPEARSALQPVISAHPFRSLDLLPPGHSALSGWPLLDFSQSWPERDGRPLDFLCQINFADLPSSSHIRPAAGLLAVFYDTTGSGWGFNESDLGNCVLLYQPDISRTHPVSKPGAGKHSPLRKPIRFEKTAGFSPSSSLRAGIYKLIDSGEETKAERVDDLFQTLEECGPLGTHRILSRPLLIQNDMDDDLRTASRAQGLPEDTEWTLLLQLDSDQDLGWCWGDAGYLYFWISTVDLAAGCFERPWVTLQCT